MRQLPHFALLILLLIGLEFDQFVDDLHALVLNVLLFVDVLDGVEHIQELGQFLFFFDSQLVLLIIFSFDALSFALGVFIIDRVALFEFIQLGLQLHQVFGPVVRMQELRDHLIDVVLLLFILILAVFVLD